MCTHQELNDMYIRKKPLTYLKQKGSANNIILLFILVRMGRYVIFVRKMDHWAASYTM